MFSITRLLWFAGYIHVSYPTLTSGSRFFHTLLLYLYVFHRVTLRLQMRAADRSHPIGSDIPRKIRQGPVKELWVQARLRLFFPQPRPSSGSWQKGQKRGGRARGANWRAGRASRLRPPAVPPDPSRGACTERRGAPDQRGRRESTCDTSYRSVANR